MPEDRPCYTVTPERINDPELGAYDTFGITCQAAGQSLCIRDISTNLGRVAALADRCNRNGLAAEHFRDVVEDMLAEW